jgi:hypothetical protein
LFRRAPGIGFVSSGAGNWVCFVGRRGRTQESATPGFVSSRRRGCRLASWLYTEYSNVKDRWRRRSASAAPLHWDYKLPSIGESGQVVRFQVKVDCQRQIGAGQNHPTPLGLADVPDGARRGASLQRVARLTASWQGSLDTSRLIVPIGLCTSRRRSRALWEWALRSAR